MSRADFSGRWVLVTGASAGMGLVFAQKLAGRGAKLILCARSEERLRALAAELPTRTIVIAADLQSEAGVQSLCERVDELDIAVELVVNNAGFGGAGPFVSQNTQHLGQMTALNCTAVQAITSHFLPLMTERGHGGFIQVASVAGFLPIPYMAVYGATKAYVLNFSVALAEELRGTGVRMMALCPGPVPTEFQERAGYKLEGAQKSNQMSAAEVVDIALKDYVRGRSVSVPGRLNALQMFLQRFLSLELKARASARVMRKSGRDSV